MLRGISRKSEVFKGKVWGAFVGLWEFVEEFMGFEVGREGS